MKNGSNNKWLVMVIAFFLAVGFGSGEGDFARAEDKKAPKEVNIALISKTIREEPWAMALIQSIDRVQKEKPEGLTVNYDVMENVSYPDGERVMRTVAKTGKYDIIWAHSAYSKAVDKLRKEFPEIVWAVAGAGNEAMGGNGYWVNRMLHEPAYLLGMIAGKITKSNIVAVTATFPYPNENAPTNAFHEGAKLVNPDVKFVVSYVDSWFDPPKGKEFASAQISAGADCVYSIIFGPLEACKEKGVYAFGHEMDEAYLAPNTVVSSSVTRWDAALKYLIKAWWDHVTKGSPYNAPMEEIVFSMKDGGADIAPFYKMVDKIPDDVKKLVADKRQEIMDGTFAVPFQPQKAVSSK